MLLGCVFSQAHLEDGQTLVLVVIPWNICVFQISGGM